MTREDLRELDRQRRALAQLNEQYDALCGQLTQAGKALVHAQGDDVARQAVACKRQEQQRLHKRLQARRETYEARVRQLQQALCALRPGEREVVRLRYLEGLTWDEIEQRAGYTRAYCYKLHASAIRALHTRQEREAHEQRRRQKQQMQQEDRQQQVYERAVQALYAIAFGVPREEEKPPTPAERMKAIEMLARLCRLLDAPAQDDVREADLSGFSEDELRRIAGL